MLDDSWIESLSFLGHADPTLPEEVAALHGRPARQVGLNGYTTLETTPIAEGPAWFPFERQCLELMFTLMQKITKDPRVTPVVEALTAGQLTIVPLLDPIEFLSPTGITQLSGYWDTIAKRLYLDRELLVYQLTGSAGTAIHEGTHALDPTLDPTRHPGGFPPHIIAAAEVMAFSNDARFHADAIDFFREQRQMPADFKEWLIGNHLKYQQHSEARVRLLST